MNKTNSDPPNDKNGSTNKKIENDEHNKDLQTINDGTSPAPLLRKRVPSISVPRKFCIQKKNKCN